MENIDNKLSSIRNILKEIPWFYFYEFPEITRENLFEYEKEFYSKALNIEKNVVEEELRTENTIRDNFSHLIKNVLKIQDTEISKLYRTLTKDSIIPESDFIQSVIQGFNNSQEALLSIYFSSAFHKAYYFITKLGLSLPIDRKINAKFCGTKSNLNSQEIMINVESNEKFSSNKRNDNLLLIGCNDSSSLLDINLFIEKSPERNEKLFAIVELSDKGFSILDTTDCMSYSACRKIKREKIFKGTVFRVGSLVYFAVLDIRSVNTPYIHIREFTVKKELQNEEILINKEHVFAKGDYSIGKKGDSDIIVITEGVSDLECRFSYIETTQDWELCFESGDGIFVLIRDYSQFSQKTESDLVYLGNHEVQISVAGISMDLS